MVFRHVKSVKLKIKEPCEALFVFGDIMKIKDIIANLIAKRKYYIKNLILKNFSFTYKT